MLARQVAAYKETVPSALHPNVRLTKREFTRVLYACCVDGCTHSEVVERDGVWKLESFLPPSSTDPLVGMVLEQERARRAGGSEGGSK
jgi:hypothetical protein